MVTTSTEDALVEQDDELKVTKIPSLASRVEALEAEVKELADELRRLRDRDTEGDWPKRSME
jgi:cell division protein FtsB